MPAFRKSLLFALMVMALCWPGLAAAAQDDNEAQGQALAETVAATDLFTEWLSAYPNYHFNAYGPDENGVWYIEFYDEPWEEWLGYANINQDTLEILESFAPVPLDADVYQEQLAALQEYVLNDAEVLAWLNNTPDLWEVYPDWNRWEQQWEIRFSRGIVGVLILATVDENDDVYLGEILDPNQLDEEEALQAARDSAINLAYSAKNADSALSGHDDWKTYVEQQGDTIWSVSFVSGEDLLLFALVDIERQEVLQSE
jgi:hypothetical protein